MLVYKTYRKSTMKGEDLAIYDGGEGEEVKKIRVIPPHICVSVLPQTLVVKAVN